MHDVADSPALPHLLVCCEHEVFGLPVLEAAFGVYFASREMAVRLARRWPCNPIGSRTCTRERRNPSLWQLSHALTPATNRRSRIGAPAFRV